METWYEDTCRICKKNDTNFLDDACDECEAIMGNRIAQEEFLSEKIETYFGKALD